MRIRPVRRSRFLSGLIVGLAMLLASCGGYPTRPHDAAYPDAAKGIDSALEEAATQKPQLAPPAAVTDALLPALPSQQLGDSQGDEARFDITVDRVAARDFFIGLTKGTRYNMAVHPDVKGEITLDLRDVTVADVMNVAREMYGYAYTQRGNLYQVMPAGLRSQIFKIDYLNLIRRGRSETTVSSGGVGNADTANTGDNNASSDNNDDNVGNSGNNNQNTYGTRITTDTEASFWSELNQSLQVIVGNGEGRSVVITPQAGLIVVRAHPDELLMVSDYLEKAELIMRRQVVLEAKILEIDLNDGFQAGVNWTAIMTPGDNTLGLGISGEPLTGPENVGGVFGMTADTGDFTAIIELLETQGNVQVLSSPRVSTINNQKAVIKVGTDEFFVTDISSTNTDTTNTTNGENTQDIELTPFFSGIALDVTPQISDNEEIVLHVHPSISDVQDQVKTIVIGERIIELPLALSTIRETDTVVFSRSNQVIVLGGLMQTVTREQNAGVPVLGRMPWLGGLFSQQRSQTVKSELVVLLKPILMGADGLPDDAQQSLERIREMRKAFDGDYRNQNATDKN
jgi:MSHA biogenesis protein MshL